MPIVRRGLRLSATTEKAISQRSFTFAQCSDHPTIAWVERLVTHTIALAAIALAVRSRSATKMEGIFEPLVNTCCIFCETVSLQVFRLPIQVKHRLPAPADSPRISLPGREVQAMTDRRQLIRNASCWAVALSLAMALSTTESEAQPSGRPPSGPRPPSGRPPGPPRRRRGRRWGFGPRKHCWWGPHGRHCKWW
jgi:hypothetical protein